MKLHLRNPEFHLMVDKYEVKSIVKEKIGCEYVVPCHGVWTNANDIEFDKLPYPVVLKTTGDTGGVIVCKSEESIDRDWVRRRLNNAVSHNFFYQSREWPYKHVKPRIIADEYLDEGTGKELVDYKFWCFNGEPQIMYCSNKAWAAAAALVVRPSLPTSPPRPDCQKDFIRRIS